MRNITAFVSLVLLTACAPERADPGSGDFTGVAYYDRNSDGIADFELHVPGCDDCDWGLVDADFNGRYEKQVLWGYSLVKTKVDAPVPKNVVLTAGQPPYGWAD